MGLLCLTCRRSREPEPKLYYSSGSNRRFRLLAAPAPQYCLTHTKLLRDTDVLGTPFAAFRIQIRSDPDHSVGSGRSLEEKDPDPTYYREIIISVGFHLWKLFTNTTLDGMKIRRQHQHHSFTGKVMKTELSYFIQQKLDFIQKDKVGFGSI
jgi:hypothetical protein